MAHVSKRTERRPHGGLPIINPSEGGRWRPAERYASDSLQDTKQQNSKSLNVNGSRMDVIDSHGEIRFAALDVEAIQARARETNSSSAQETMSPASEKLHRRIHSIDPTLQAQEDSETESVEPSGRPRKIRKRLPAEEGQFRCDFPDCGRIYDRHSDLTKHQKYHLPENERPYKCSVCGRGFLFPKDLKRHESLHQNDDVSGSRASPQATPVSQGLVQDHFEVPKRKYQYQPLRDCEVRILTLLPGVDNEIHCKLTHHDLSSVAQTHPYEALSWFWGDLNWSSTIFLSGPGNGGGIMRVTPNLHAALKCLRHVDRPRRLWIDGICIDHDNSGERALQVSHMDKIFSSADNVCVWLGEESDHSGLALRFVKDLTYNLGDLPAVAKGGSVMKEWQALFSLMSRRWFSRRWAVQEIAFARRASVHCGDSSVDWNEFETAVAMFERVACGGLLWKASESAAYDPNSHGDVASMAATHLVRTVSDLFRRNDRGEIVERRYTLSDLISNFSFLEVSDPRDLFYSILSVAKDVRMSGTSWQVDKNQSRDISGGKDSDAVTALSMGEALDTSSSAQDQQESTERVIERYAKSKIGNIDAFPIDYHSSFLDVCQQFVAFVVPRSVFPNLDILCRPWALAQRPYLLPSWIPSIAKAAFGQPTQRIPGRVKISRQNADPLVGLTTYNTPCYNASASQVARKDDWRFGDQSNGEHEYSLFLTGFVVDSINEIEDSSQVGNVPLEWLRLAGWDLDDENSNVDVADHPPEMLWRTLVADRGPEGANAKVYYQRAFEHAVRGSGPTVGVATSELKRFGNPILVEFLHRMEAVIWNRRLFKSYRDIFLGLAPKEAKEGDRICILKGMSVPVVLRRMWDESRESEYYHMLGDCYLYSMMDGRAIEVQEQLGIPTEMFEIR